MIRSSDWDWVRVVNRCPEPCSLGRRLTTGEMWGTMSWVQRINSSEVMNQIEEGHKQCDNVEPNGRSQKDNEDGFPQAGNPRQPITCLLVVHGRQLSQDQGGGPGICVKLQGVNHRVGEGSGGTHRASPKFALPKSISVAKRFASRRSAV